MQYHDLSKQSSIFSVYAKSAQQARLSSKEEEAEAEAKAAGARQAFQMGVGALGKLVLGKQQALTAETSNLLSIRDPNRKSGFKYQYSEEGKPTAPTGKLYDPRSLMSWLRYGKDKYDYSMRPASERVTLQGYTDEGRASKGLEVGHKLKKEAADNKYGADLDKEAYRMQNEIERKDIINKRLRQLSKEGDWQWGAPGKEHRKGVLSVAPPITEEDVQRSLANRKVNVDSPYTAPSSREQYGSYTFRPLPMDKSYTKPIAQVDELPVTFSNQPEGGISFKNPEKIDPEAFLESYDFKPNPLSKKPKGGFSFPRADKKAGRKSIFKEEKFDQSQPEKIPLPEDLPPIEKEKGSGLIAGFQQKWDSAVQRRQERNIGNPVYDPNYKSPVAETPVTSPKIDTGTTGEVIASAPKTSKYKSIVDFNVKVKGMDEGPLRTGLQKRMNQMYGQVPEDVTDKYGWLMDEENFGTAWEATNPVASPYIPAQEPQTFMEDIPPQDEGANIWSKLWNILKGDEPLATSQ